MIVELFKSGEKGKNHEREIIVYHHEKDRKRRVQKMDRLFNDSHALEKMIEQPALTEDRDPGIHVQQNVHPKREDEQDKPCDFIFFCAESDKIGDRIG